MDYTRTTALVVVDVQNDFADPDGSLFVAGGHAAVPFINQQIEAALEASASVVYTRDWHPDTTPHFAKDGGIWPVHCVGDTWGSDFHPDLVVTVCDHAAEACPVFPGAPRTIHHAFRDPAKATGEEEEILGEFRQVRDEIRNFVKGLPGLLSAGGAEEE